MYHLSGAGAYVVLIIILRKLIKKLEAKYKIRTAEKTAIVGWNNDADATLALNIMG